ncbi:Membrane protein [Candidatus Desulfosporosinus infrequens]|uniref:Membrane protein n=1 Tax=Candidatus Desulfosporosinus infrequens TaxID=2043169 RepID=A0A2U3LND9_9FIRM|nr:Membrane protein [Candidatus Desulfosporosinus infrequens]
MMFLGIIIFLIGLFLVFDCKNHGLDWFCFCRRDDEALDILRERYAHGEITTDEFNTMKNIIS